MDGPRFGVPKGPLLETSVSLHATHVLGPTAAAVIGRSPPFSVGGAPYTLAVHVMRNLVEAKRQEVDEHLLNYPNEPDQKKRTSKVMRFCQYYDGSYNQSVWLVLEPADAAAPPARGRVRLLLEGRVPRLWVAHSDSSFAPSGLGSVHDADNSVSAPISLVRVAECARIKVTFSFTVSVVPEAEPAPLPALQTFARAAWENDRELCDVTLVASDGTEVRAHRLVLASQSEYWRALLLRWSSDRIDMSNLVGADLERLVRFVYTGVVDESLTAKEALSMLDAGEAALLPGLAAACEARAVAAVEAGDPNDALQAFRVAGMHRLSGLAAAALERIRAHLPEIMADPQAWQVMCNEYSDVVAQFVTVDPPPAKKQRHT